MKAILDVVQLIACDGNGLMLFNLQDSLQNSVGSPACPLIRAEMISFLAVISAACQLQPRMHRKLKQKHQLLHFGDIVDLEFPQSIKYIYTSCKTP